MSAATISAISRRPLSPIAWSNWRPSRALLKPPSKKVGLENRGSVEALRICSRPLHRKNLSVYASSSPLLPGGAKQAKVKIPALLLEISADDVLSNESTAGVVKDAVDGGATGVIIMEGQSGGAGLFDAACRLKGAVQGRAALLVLDRTDIADAAGADGVVLSERGKAQCVPIAVARRLLSGANSLIGSLISDTAGAVASARQGSNFVLLQGAIGAAAPTVKDIRSAVSQQKAGSIPVLARLQESAEDARSIASEVAACAEASGLSLRIRDIASYAEAVASQPALDPAEASRILIRALTRVPKGIEETEAQPSKAGVQAQLRSAREDIVSQEKSLLNDILEMLKEVSPGISEIELLEDSIRNLDDKFLLVVVGEFNSGKSSFINALLGERFVAEGILPTTNEISILRWAETGLQRSEQDADGMYQRFIPADLLREINIVDTPGTNVVLQRQQRLTEEYIPRADLVLFVLSADRPFTDSEVKFLKYIRQWGKKLLFVVNKVDLLSDESQIGEVVEFVSSNALELLGVDRPQVLPVSSRDALRAKLAAGSSGTGLSTSALAGSKLWQGSRFAKLESTVLDYLVGNPGKLSESMRLKMQTPLAIADALLGASQQQLLGDLSSAEKDLKALELVAAQLDAFRLEMERDSSIQREKLQRLIRTATSVAGELVDRELQLSSSNLASYMFRVKGEKPQDQPVARAFKSDIAAVSSELQSLVEEHGLWIKRNTERQLSNYRSFASARARQLGVEVKDDPFNERRGVLARPGLDGPLSAAAPASTAVRELEPESAAVILNEEVRESFVLTGTAFAGAGVLEAVGTSILPTTLEDLLVTAVAGVVAYLAVLNLPLRRAETKAKVQRVSANFSKEVNEAMEYELEVCLNDTTQTILTLIEPLIKAAREEVAKVKLAESRRAALSELLEEMREAASSIS